MRFEALVLRQAVEAVASENVVNGALGDDQVMIANQVHADPRRSKAVVLAQVENLSGDVGMIGPAVPLPLLPQSVSSICKGLRLMPNLRHIGATLQEAAARILRRQFTRRRC